MNLIKHYQSLHEAHEDPIHPINQNHSYVNADYGASHGRDWFGYGINSSAEARRILECGWPDGVRLINDALHDIGAVPRTRSVRRRRVQSDFGDSIDMQRVYAGALDKAWTRAERTAVGTAIGQNTAILVQVNANSNIKASELFWRGAAAAHVADMLCTSGRNVEVVAFSASVGVYHSSDFSLHSVKVKDFRDPMDMEKIAATTAFPPFFRYTLLRAKLTHNQRARESLGSAMYHYKPTASDFNLAPNTSIIHIANVFDAHSARQMIESITTMTLAAEENNDE